MNQSASLNIPAAPLCLGLAGLIPFLWGAATFVLPGVSDLGLQVLGPRFVAPFVLLSYGTIILAFMSGVLWGFATKSVGGQAARNYALSTLPALWVFFMVDGSANRSPIALIVGFIGLLALDWVFAKQGLTPPWWMKLRLLLTAVVVFCLSVLL